MCILFVVGLPSQTSQTSQQRPSGQSGAGGNLPSGQYVQPSQGQQQAGTPSGYPQIGGITIIRISI